MNEWFIENKIYNEKENGDCKKIQLIKHPHNIQI